MISITLDTGGSEFGGSQYEKILSCPRKAKLDALAKANSPPGKTTIADDAFGVGTLFHAFMELYYSKQLSSPEQLKEVVLLSPDGTAADVDPQARAEAERVAAEYIHLHPSNTYGKIVGQELLMPLSEKDTAAVEAAVGISPWTGRVDLIGKLGQAQVDGLRQKFFIDVTEPGVYLVDFKTGGSEDQALQDRMVNSHQFTAYLLAWNAVATPANQAKGLIVDMTIKTKSPKFRKYFVPAPNESQVESLHTRWKGLQVIMEHLSDWPNAGSYNCFGLGRICNHWLSGACDRT